MNTTITVDEFIAQEKKWQTGFRHLRHILNEFPLEEVTKWGKPCYALNGKNIVIIQGFKDYFALMFFKGVLIEDSDHLLIQMSADVQSARQLRFKNSEEVLKQSSTISAYIQQAMAIEAAGLEVQLQPAKSYPIPEELQRKFDYDPSFSEAFYALTPGRQRNYLLFFNKAKQSITRISRIEKYESLIRQGKGLNE